MRGEDKQQAIFKTPDTFLLRACLMKYANFTLYIHIISLHPGGFMPALTIENTDK
jgi:hypothetical protein